MSRLFRIAMIFSLLAAGLVALPAAAAPQVGCDPDFTLNDAVDRVCMPPGWTPGAGDLVLYAHGYVDPFQPIAIPESQLVLPDGTSIPALINSLGYAFATTSYHVNGLAIQEGIGDLVDLVGYFKQNYGQPRHIYLVGASEGGLVTALALERRPDVFSGGLATCGPIGDFRRQVNYWGDFRVVFDAFFPGFLGSSAVSIPPEVIANWPAELLAISGAIQSQPLKTLQLLSVTQAPINPFDSTTIPQTVGGILWYNVFATNDGVTKLTGQPFDNSARYYRGSFNDFWLNLKVARYHADQAALDTINQLYQTSGKLKVPMVSLHTTGDPIVPYWHEDLYRQKVLSAGSAGLYRNIPILRYGHCAFKSSEVLVGFALLVLKVNGLSLVNAHAALRTPEAQADYDDLAGRYLQQPDSGLLPALFLPALAR